MKGVKFAIILLRDTLSKHLTFISWYLAIMYIFRARKKMKTAKMTSGQLRNAEKTTRGVLKCDLLAVPDAARTLVLLTRGNEGQSTSGFWNWRQLLSASRALQQDRVTNSFGLPGFQHAAKALLTDQCSPRLSDCVCPDVPTLDVLVQHNDSTVCPQFNFLWKDHSQGRRKQMPANEILLKGFDKKRGSEMGLKCLAVEGNSMLEYFTFEKGLLKGAGNRIMIVRTF